MDRPDPDYLSDEELEARELGRSKASQRSGASITNDARPVIQLRANEIERIVNEAEAALIRLIAGSTSETAR